MEGGTLPDTIAFINPLSIAWEVTVDGGKNWVNAGESDNRVYVTLAAPMTRYPLYETVLDIASRNADGARDPDLAVAAIWADFAGPLPGVKRKAMDGYNKTDGLELHYWADAHGSAAFREKIQSQCYILTNMLDASPEDPQLSGIGTCTAWARLFDEAIRSEGIEGSQMYQITPRAPSPGRLILIYSMILGRRCL